MVPPVGAPGAVPNEIPAGMMVPGGEFYGPESQPAGNDATETLPTPPKVELHGPMSATQIPSAEFQFGAAGRSEQVQALVADGRLRRLPLISVADTRPAAATPLKPSIFPPPGKETALLAPVDGEQPRTAERDSSGTNR